MKDIKFRPLRRMKSGKIATPNYTTWSKVRTANYSEFNLIIDTEYRDLPDDEFVHNHKGELLFFYEYSPNDIKIFDSPLSITTEEIFATTKVRGINWGSSTSYSGKGIDCNGTPTFSHFTTDYVGDPAYGFNVSEFEPLTVGLVKEWYLWFLLGLNKANLTTTSK